MFSWLEFLRDHQIEFLAEGKNVAAGNVNIHCPFCGARDPSKHLGLHLQSNAWGCWRDDTHRGRAPQRLVMRLLGCSWDTANKLVSERGGLTTDETWKQLKDKLRTPEAQKESVLPEVALDENFFPLGTQTTRGRRSTGLFEEYLWARHFDEPLVLADQYDLMGCLAGPYRWRLIFPIYLRYRLVGWTGRAITNAQLRYKSHPPGEQRALLYNYDAARDTGGRLLLLAEGPVDTLKLDYYGKALGARCVGLLGLNLSPGKLALLAALAERFERVVICLDRGALAQALEFQARTAVIPGVQVARLEVRKDPGELRPREVAQFLRSFLS